MSKTSIKITALALTFFSCMSVQGNAKETFEGCVEKPQNCQNLCTGGVSTGYTVTYKDAMCKDFPKKTNGCYCDYKD